MLWHNVFLIFKVKILIAVSVRFQQEVEREGWEATIMCGGKW